MGQKQGQQKPKLKLGPEGSEARTCCSCCGHLGVAVADAGADCGFVLKCIYKNSTPKVQRKVLLEQCEQKQTQWLESRVATCKVLSDRKEENSF
jgi:hypothetical protein